MSGSKDYVVDYEPARLRQIELTLQQLVQDRSAATKKRLDEGRRQARETIDHRRDARKKKNEEQRDSARRETAKRVASFATTNNGPGSADGLREDKRYSQSVQDAVDDVRSAVTILFDGSLDLNAEESNAYWQRQIQTAQECKSDEEILRDVSRIKATVEERRSAGLRRADELREGLGTLESWKQELAGEETVKHFRSQEASTWTHDAESLLQQYSDGLPMTQSLERCLELCRTAQGIFDDAGKQKAQFEARNVLLVDIIDSLKAIGFTVVNPQFEDADNPLGPVIVVASRGREQMTARVDLSTTVQSVWDGVTNTGCQDSFFAFVEQMQQRKASIQPKRDDLSRPPSSHHVQAPQSSPLQRGN